MINAKNRLKELLEALGQPHKLASYLPSQDSQLLWTSTVVVTLPTLPPVEGVGSAMNLTQAEIAAAEMALAGLAVHGLAVDHWASINAEAQAGDALLKLAGYLAPGLTTPETRSRWLQAHESDGRLAAVFDAWSEQGLPELALYGRGLGQKSKSSLVEALIWRRFGARVLGPEAAQALAELRAALTVEAAVLATPR